MEVYVKGKYERGIGAAAYVVVCEGVPVAQGAKRLGREFAVDGQTFPCDALNMEVLAAVCGLARCGEERLVNVYTNSACVVGWLNRGGEPAGRTALLDCYRRRAVGKDVLADYIPFYDKDPSDNPWNRECERLAREALNA